MKHADEKFAKEKLAKEQLADEKFMEPMPAEDELAEAAFGAEVVSEVHMEPMRDAQEPHVAQPRAD